VALYKVRGVVLRSAPFGEADRLVTLLSPERGKLRAVAKGARRSRSRLAVAVQPFVEGRFVLWQGRSLDGISQAEIAAPHRGLAADLSRLAAASYCAELTDALWEEHDAHDAPEAFDLLCAALGLIEGGGPEGHPVVLRWCELHLLAGAGFAPRLEACAQCGGELPAAGALTFAAEAGGLLCGGCRAAGGDPGRGPGAATDTCVDLGPGGVAALRYLAAAAPERLAGVTVAPSTMGSLSRALSAQLRSILQRPLKSQAILDILSP
jgi:DNA repair protein RecO (recombination protein O)